MFLILAGLTGVAERCVEALIAYYVLPWTKCTEFVQLTSFWKRTVHLVSQQNKTNRPPAFISPNVAETSPCLGNLTYPLPFASLLESVRKKCQLKHAAKRARLIGWGHVP